VRFFTDGHNMIVWNFENVTKKLSADEKLEILDKAIALADEVLKDFPFEESDSRRGYRDLKINTLVEQMVHAKKPPSPEKKVTKKPKKKTVCTQTEAEIDAEV